MKKGTNSIIVPIQKNLRRAAINALRWLLPEISAQKMIGESKKG
jgi:hypothetical protein